MKKNELGSTIGLNKTIKFIGLIFNGESFVWTIPICLLFYYLHCLPALYSGLPAGRSNKRKKR